MKGGLDVGAEAHMNRPNIIFSRLESEPGREHPRWDVRRARATVFRWILEGKIDGSLVVAPVVKFGDGLREQYERVVVRAERGIRLGVEY